MKTPDKEEPVARTSEAPAEAPVSLMGGVPLDEHGKPILEVIDLDNQAPVTPDATPPAEKHDKEEAEAQQKLHELLRKAEAPGPSSRKTSKDNSVRTSSNRSPHEQRKSEANIARNAPPPQLIDEKNEKMFLELEREPWFHGTLPMEDIQMLLQNKGDFLIRRLEPEGDKSGGPSLAVRWDTMLEFPIYRINVGKESHFTIDGNLSKPTVVELIKVHLEGVPIGEDVHPSKGIEQQAWQFSKDRIEKTKKLGEGQFGEVWRGKLEYNRKHVDVAIKVTKVSNKQCLEEFYRESRLMRQLRHINIVNFYGIIIQNDSVTIVMELMEDGGLDSYLKKNQVSMEMKASFCFDAAFGLYYLHNKGILHRDVAARNCLVHMAKSIVKISDFGLSKQSETYKLQPKEVVPIRWQSPELLRTKMYTKACDIYSFGLLMWEVFNDGVVPFAGSSTAEIRKQIHDPKFRPAITENISKAPVEIATTMSCAWSANPEHRPLMKECCRILFKFCKHAIPNLPIAAPKADTGLSNKTKKVTRKDSNATSMKAVSIKAVSTRTRKERDSVKETAKEAKEGDEMSRKPSKKKTKSSADASAAVSKKKKRNKKG